MIQCIQIWKVFVAQILQRSSSVGLRLKLSTVRSSQVSSAWRSKPVPNKVLKNMKQMFCPIIIKATINANVLRRCWGPSPIENCWKRLIFWRRCPMFILMNKYSGLEQKEFAVFSSNNSSLAFHRFPQKMDEDFMQYHFYTRVFSL